MLKLAVSGATGRMGKEVITAINAEADVILTEVLVRDGHALLGKRVADVIKLNNNVYSLVFTKTLAESKLADVLIDFSLPAATMNYVAQCIELKLPMVIGTTGFSIADKQVLQQAAQEIPIILAPNMSVGINICYNLLALAAQAMGLDWQVAISETHHQYKKDAPSGTALKMGEIISQNTGLADDKIQYNSLRLGDIIGEHQVLFVGNSEQITIAHRATTRQAFAKGALSAAKWLIAKPPGLYTMQDVIKDKLSL